MSRANGAEIQSAEVAGPDYNPFFYFEDGDKEHAVWFLDVVTFLNELREVRAQKAGGFGLYRLGSEDPAIWDVLNVPPDFKMDQATREAMQILKGTDTITDVGDGEIVTVDESRSDGARTVAVDDQGYLTAKYTRFPEFPTLYHQGAGDPHQVAITFDDGPDPEWTPKILDILKAANVKAAFFLVGVNAEHYPGLVRRIVEEGHEIGNHTYYHPNLALCWPEHVRLELNATQLLIETITGRATTFFRPPYAADTSPSRLSELMPLQIAQTLNYLVVLENIDPQDWARPGSDIILQRVKQQRRDGSIILLHDAGGDRSQTVEALPQILDWLRIRGDTVVPLSKLIGSTRDAVMPPVQKNNQALARLVSSTGFHVYHAVEEFLWAFMIVATALVVGRTLIVIWLAYRFKRTPRVEFAQPASVVIAAYNEGKVIAGTLRSLLATDYRGELEVIVVDDGSTDDTAAEIDRVTAADPRVRLLCQENRGKARALQRALSAARHPVVVFIDADTQCQRDTLPRLLEPLADAQIGAVSGHAKVGNLRTFIARCQALEYTCGFNLDRRAYDRWNCITVVPGAISAVRKQVLDCAGGLRLETLAEDTDLTLALHRQGQRIVYAPDAVAWTEAPETVATLARQRFRWAYGTLQCLWKHRDMVFNWNYRALGWFSLPSVWFFQITLVAVTPMVDLFLLASLPFGTWRAVLPFVITFLAMDVILATLACILEREPILRAWRILPMRLIYRPMLSYCIWKAILRAVKGAWVSWGKLERYGQRAGPGLMISNCRASVSGAILEIGNYRTSAAEGGVSRRRLTETLCKLLATPARTSISGFIILACLFLPACKKRTAQARVDPNGPVEVVLPEHGVYTGAYVDFGDEEDDVSLETIEDFEKMVGKHQAIIASSSYWGEQSFPTANLNLIWRHGSLPLLFWSPWDKPYDQHRGPDKFSLKNILTGQWDAYIDKWADSARAFAHPIIVVFGVEMNGDWFPWSGIYYGGNQRDEARTSWKGPETFKAAYRYVVDRVRARGATQRSMDVSHQ